MAEQKERQLQLELHAVIQKPAGGHKQLKVIQEVGHESRRVKEKRQSGYASVEGFHEGGSRGFTIQAFKPRPEETNEMYIKGQILAGRKIRDG